MDLLLLSFAACTSPTSTDDGPPPPTDEATDGVLAHSGLRHSFRGPDSGWHSGETGHSATETMYSACDEDPPVGPFPSSSTDIIRTEEDFDFDGTQYLLTQRGISMAGITRQGVVDILAGNIGSDAAGIRSLPTGDVLVAQPDTGGVRRVNLANGSSVNVLTAANPNGLEVSSTGAAFVSEFVPNGRVREFDPYTGVSRVIANLASPNNMVMSPDERTLYVITTQNGFGPSTVVALDRDGSGGWDPPRDVYRANEFLGGIAVDLCGDLYLTGFSSGHVFRLRVPEGTREPIADLQGLYGSYSAAHFSPGLAGWSPTELYVTNRQLLYVIDVGVEGRHVLRP